MSVPRNNGLLNRCSEGRKSIIVELLLVFLQCTYMYKYLYLYTCIADLELFFTYASCSTCMSLR